jgi:hypothetical protein
MGESKNFSGRFRPNCKFPARVLSAGWLTADCDWDEILRRYSIKRNWFRFAVKIRNFGDLRNGLGWFDLTGMPNILAVAIRVGAFTRNWKLFGCWELMISLKYFPVGWKCWLEEWLLCNFYCKSVVNSDLWCFENIIINNCRKLAFIR